MNPGSQNVPQRPAPAPLDEQVGPGLGRQQRNLPRVTSRREVMDTLLGKNDLSAFDASGGDPYNATGRHFRR